MSVEKAGRSQSGWTMLAVVLVAFIGSIIWFINGIAVLDRYDSYGFGNPGAGLLALLGSCILFTAACIVCGGFFTLQPGQARVCVLFGKYVGTVREEGLRWANPFLSRNLGITASSIDASELGIPGLSAGKTHRHGSIVSTRARTLNGDPLKVNDKMGNPIEIATVVVWHVSDTAKAIFDVDDYESFVSMQTETALRHVASVYAYDHMEDEDDSTTAITLRSNIEEVSDALRTELGNRLSPAGVAVDDARLTHLAYAPEIAQAMLRRQQAEAVIAARKKIVEGAVSMVNMALSQLSQDGVVEFDDDRKAAMASNLMVVLCGESDAQPVVSTGTMV